MSHNFSDRDAKYIHKAMAGLGTKDRLLILRCVSARRSELLTDVAVYLKTSIVRAKWNPAHLAQVKQAYQAKRGKG